MELPTGRLSWEHLSLVHIQWDHTYFCIITTGVHTHLASIDFHRLQTLPCVSLPCIKDTHLLFNFISYSQCMLHHARHVILTTCFHAINPKSAALSYSLHINALSAYISAKKHFSSITIFNYIPQDTHFKPSGF